MKCDSNLSIKKEINLYQSTKDVNHAPSLYSNRVFREF